MERWLLRALLIPYALVGLSAMGSASKLVPANHPYIQYFGRWDRSDSLRPRFSWPGVRIGVEFNGTSIGVRLDDHTDYFNVYIDGKLHGVFHGTQEGVAGYLLADSLEPGHHTFLLSRRNITLGEVYAFEGILLDAAGELLPPKPLPSRRIEFIGDSFTAAESNEAVEQQLPWEQRLPVTNIDKGFAANIARHFNAQYTTTCRSGSGMVCDWQGNRRESLPALFDHALMDTSMPKWNFRQWIPDVVVICLGLNDASGLRDRDGTVPAENSALFRRTYHEFLATVRNAYPGVRIVAVAAFPEWIRTNVRAVVDEELAPGKTDVYYAQFDEFPGGYVANGHPTVATHQRMADEIIGAMETFPLFRAEK